jgi:hypothetical protein
VVQMKATFAIIGGTVLGLMVLVWLVEVWLK